MQSKFNKGAAYARDLIIEDIMEMQNEAGEDLSRFITLQELLELIADTYGDMEELFKG